MELISQFTKDAIAKEDRVCGRPACRGTILKGAPCYYVATIVPGQPGRFVCEACYLQYSQKLSTSVRPSSVHPSSAQSQLLRDPHIIRQTVNVAQRKLPFLSQPSSSTAHIGRISGPDIAVPLSWQQSLASSNTNMVSGAVGYSVHHAQYGLEREQWAKLAYAPPPAETITLEISAVYEGNSQKKSGHSINFGNICEGKKDVDTRLDAPGLIQITLETILPKILTFRRGFLWRTEEFIVRDATWVDLSGHLPAILYFLAQCLVQSQHRPKTTTFKTKQFSLMVVVPAVQWTKRAHVCGESDSTNSTVSPPHKKPAPGVFHLPDRHDLKEALKSGGSVDAVCAPKVYDFCNKDIQFHPIPVRPLADILKTPQYHSFKPNISNSFIRQLTIDVPICSMIGISAFKTAHPGWLTLSPLSSSGLGLHAQQDVVIKWPFHRPPSHTIGSNTLKISRYTLPDEHKKLLNEYVKAGMFSAVYLLERVTSGTPNDQTFTKFIHNKDYGPSLDEDEYGYDLAVFLSFTQHVQYEKTEGLAFISDYQGSTELLTDPQILTHRSVNEGIDLFGDGNIASVVDDFKAGHLCNRYCKWPGFGLEVYT
ncbi:hypothetical protein EDB19DRAFT_1823558 [Suillus lakei]|nr:hypothetical protein EDB19DRAFT_1823558 [Suillus lakei]